LPLLGQYGQKQPENNRLTALTEEEEVEGPAKLLLGVAVADPGGEQVIEVVGLGIGLLREVLLQVHNN
jgi:hypothetical protein